MKNGNSLDRNRRGSGRGGEEECVGEGVPSRRNRGLRHHKTLKKVRDT